MKKIILCNLAVVVTVLFFAGAASSQETYKFERMWPTLKQPWYFSGPCGVAIDDSGLVYVVDTYNNRIQKFTSDGQFVAKWGSFGSGDGQFNTPFGVAIDINGFVYVADFNNFRIQKFTSDGQFVAKWGSYGGGDGQFSAPSGIAIDINGFVYVADRDNHRIQKFTADGLFVTKWGSYGTGDGQFNEPQGIAIDGSGFVYVVDSNNHRVQKFTSSGQFVAKWGSYGSGDGQLYSPYGIAIDINGFVYVADRGNRRIQKFTSDGQFVAKWGISGGGDGQFNYPRGIATDKSGLVYVADTENCRIQKFTSDGQFVEKWGSGGSGDGQFKGPAGIAIDGSGLVYVADQDNHRIQKFTSDGQFVAKWGSYGSGDGQFTGPTDIAIDGSGLVYVSEYSHNSRIQKFTSDGQFVAKWGSYCVMPYGSSCVDPDGEGPLEVGDGQFYYPYGIAVDSSGFLYVVDKLNHRIQKFTSDGQFVTKWGSYGSGDGQFNDPFGITTDSSGLVYVTDYNNCIQKFTSDGQFVAKWGSYGSGDGQFQYPRFIAVDSSDLVYVADSYNDRLQVFETDGNFLGKFGTFGTQPGQLNKPTSIAVNETNGNFYVTESTNNRIQVFKEVNILTNPRAIIVAGRASAQDSLWDATQVCTNFAYRALTYQGYTDSDIYYLSSDTDLDLSGDGVPDVDANATLANLQYAITQWALNEGADSLVLYLNDHGGPDTFRLSETEILTAAQLNTWLDDLQSSISGTIAVVYEACESGSFVDNLQASDRIIITSTLPGEQAKFLSQGNISFSSFFWTHIFNGLSIEESYLNASQVVNFSFTNQNPQLSGNAENVYIGSGVSGMIGEAPDIGSVSPPQEIDVIETADLYADEVIDADGIARVWAVIWPPNYDPGSSENPLLSLPTCELFPVGDNRFEGTYAQFTADGMYQIAIYALDRANNTSIPKVTTVSRNYHLDRRAVIVAGASSDTVTRSMIETNAGIAYDALKAQLYTDAEIYFMSVTTFRTEVDGGSYNSNLQSYLTGLAGDAEIENLDLTIYLIGKGDTGTFTMNEDPSPDVLYASSQLDTWLDSLQNTKPGRVVVVYDADKSGSFISLLTPPASKERISITSSAGDGAAYFSPDGNVCFSSFFFGQVASGATIYNSFAHAKQAIAYLSRKKDISFSCYPMQSPILDADGDGTPNEEADYQVARSRTIGIGMKFADDPPQIGSASVEANGEEVTIVADNITSTGEIDRVWAVVKPIAYCPGDSGGEEQELDEVELIYTYEGSRYESTSFTPPDAYKVNVYAMDVNGNTSLPKETKIYQEGGDIYEPDETRDDATVIVPGHPTPQPHTFHYAADEDWVMFYGVSGEYYSIEASNLEADCEPVLELFYEDDTVPIDIATTVIDNSVSLDFECQEDGMYYVHLFNGTTGTNTGYDLKVYYPYWPDLTLIAGGVQNQTNYAGINGAVITTDGGGAAISVNGEYELMQKPGNWWMSGAASGYSSYGGSISVATDVEFIQRDILMNPVAPPDDDGDGVPTGTDNCPYRSNTNQADANSNGIGDACENDKGDVNGNGDIDAADIQMIVNIFLGTQTPTPQQLWAADYNNNQAVNVIDVQRAINKLLNP